MDLHSKITETRNFVANVPQSDGGLKSSNPGADAAATQLSVWGFVDVCRATWGLGARFFTGGSPPTRQSHQPRRICLANAWRRCS